ncbi:hypothetical protein [Cryobacterium psychrophilum]|uniref:Uncharacterized protein n=1 Tax=Cryobacterium psychrophilum TaxID=41988 RepID=A0A4Y8KP41_9MICO|nr:hypothetical protein [Cryobacterium psychrophilum]TDW30564.1 hypothetical protein EDD25_2327 [Cryobacterium psychrophilum]TFD80219.1 hypothetical protein E3T53_05785 [Cryobacterium psychrophilum]
MNAPDATQQRLDPIGGLAVWPLALVTALIVVAYAVFSTLTQAGEVRYPMFAALAVVSLVGAAGLLVWASLPESAPFQAGSSLVMVGLALLAYILEQVGMWGHNASVHNDFGQIALGLLIMALAPFRPWREIALLAAAAAVVVACGAWVQAAYFATGTPALFAILATVQLLAPALAGAAYCRQVVKSIRIWQTDAQRSIRLHTEASRVSLAGLVVHQRLCDLDANVLPFLSEVLQRGSVTAVEIDRARRLADEVRGALVAETDRTWLDDLVARESAALTEIPAVVPANGAGPNGAGPLGLGVGRVHDDERRAARFTPRQRAAFGALVVMLCAQPGFDPSSLAILISSARQAESAVDADDARHSEGAAVVLLEASVALPARHLRAVVHPFVAVLRVEFSRVHVAIRGHRLTVHLDAEHSEAGYRNADRVQAGALPVAPTRNEH